ncbi:hypothetical protein Goshw_008776 [Gossypium schwendimanii]|uniref:Uncharacterized protein n=1 Tax=Gossypium schwendimanii TaxID=34291 RepID=A0A7J9MMK9_GOSSC|nr:hypothetical protein [Gossypium schwendimanii]
MMNIDSRVWLTWFFKNNSVTQCCLLCCALWVIWTERNKWLDEGKGTPAKSIFDSILSYIRELDRLGDKDAIGRIMVSPFVLNCNIASPFTIKALACAQAMHLGLDLGLQLAVVRRGVAGKGSKVGQRARLRDRPWSNLDWEGENGDELKNEEEK